MTTSRIDRAQSAMIKASDCSTCKYRGKCEYEAILESWRYSGTNCNLWEKWNASDAT
ncbi:hypothetical protein [Phormidium tenue]|uniref:Uncharacterized protein n=1 Tax=Phormidium tenue FACHB-1050 TaxID=2692857 RepID=A0ABR8C982_9CYAN|nr:hypothetical protein [Phormidium tenue]MBD2316635.1 hypothetical protein [Phormidium tenue FACHB-1050]